MGRRVERVRGRIVGKAGRRVRRKGKKERREGGRAGGRVRRKGKKERREGGRESTSEMFHKVQYVRSDPLG